MIIADEIKTGKRNGIMANYISRKKDVNTYYKITVIWTFTSSENSLKEILIRSGKI